VRPDYCNISSTMVRFNGTAGSSSLFQGENPTAGLTGYDTWATNGNPLPLSNATTSDYANYATYFKGIDPGQPMSNTPNGGHYYVSALAVNPCDGTAWMSWGGDDRYETSGAGALPLTKYQYSGTYGPIGRVYTVGPEGTIYTAGGDQGAPLVQDGSRVVALAFHRKMVYALVADLRTDPGTFSLYKKNNPSPNCCNDVPDDIDGDPDVDVDDFAAYQACFTGSTAPATLSPTCACLDRNHDGKVEAFDFGVFLNCARGPSIPAALDCGN
jgi:hypothetical protein